jgi:hypothetical protein
MKKTIKKGSLKGEEIRIEGLWKDISGQSWMWSKGNPACLAYAVRAVEDRLPTDDNVYYGKIGAFGVLVHESEIEKEKEE